MDRSGTASAMRKWIDRPVFSFRDHAMILAVSVAIHEADAHRDLGFGFFGQGDANGVAQPIFQKRADSDC